jgi:hypothetical protein
MTKHFSDQDDFAAAISSNLKLAQDCLHNLEELRRETLEKFEAPLGNGKVRRFRPARPFSLIWAASWIARLRQEIRDFEGSGEEGFHKSSRLIVKGSLIEAQVKCALAWAIVEFWRNESGFENYPALVNQVDAYAQKCTGHDWDYSAPLVLIRENEPLDQESAKYMYRLTKHGELAFTYAKALDGEMQVGPHWPKNRSTFKPVEGELEEIATIEPADFPVCRGHSDPTSASQREMALRHIRAVSEDLHENAFLRVRQIHIIEPYTRIAGFHKKRGGRATRNREQQA